MRGSDDGRNVVGFPKSDTECFLFFHRDDVDDSTRERGRLTRQCESFEAVEKRRWL